MINKKTLKLKNYIETFRYLKEFKLRVLIVILLSTIDPSVLALHWIDNSTT